MKDDVGGVMYRSVQGCDHGTVWTLLAHEVAGSGSRHNGLSHTRFSRCLTHCCLKEGIF